MIDDAQKQEMALRQADGMRAMSKEDMARRQLEAVKGMYNAWPTDHAKGQADASNFWVCITQQHNRCKR